MRCRRRLITSVLMMGISVVAITPGLSGDAAVAETRQVHMEPNDLAWDLAPPFDFLWHSCELSTMTINRVASEQPGPALRSCTLSVAVEMTISHAENLLAVDTQNPVVFGVLDEVGSSMPWQGTEPDAHLQSYAPVALERTSKAHFNLELPLQECNLPASVSLIEGYVRALYVDRLIEVDVPFDLTGELETEAAPDLVISLDRTMPPAPTPLKYEPPLPGEDPRFYPRRPTTAIATYKWRTWIRSKTGKPVMALWTGWPDPDSRASAEYVAVETKLLDSETGEAIRLSTRQWTSSNGEQATCWGQKEQDDRAIYDVIPHILGVHPVEVKVPFVLKNVPVLKRE